MRVFVLLIIFAGCIYLLVQHQQAKTEMLAASVEDLSAELREAEAEAARMNRGSTAATEALNRELAELRSKLAREGAPSPKRPPEWQVPRRIVTTGGQVFTNVTIRSIAADGGVVINFGPNAIKLPNGSLDAATMKEILDARPKQVEQPRSLESPFEHFQPSRSQRLGLGGP